MAPERVDSRTHDTGTFESGHLLFVEQPVGHGCQGLFWCRQWVSPIAMTPNQLVIFLAVCVVAISIGVAIVNDVFEEQDQRRRNEEIARRARQHLRQRMR